MIYKNKLNDKEFENSQKELKVKKLLNEEIKEYKMSQEEELQKLEEELDRVPSKESLMIVKNKMRELEAEVEELQRSTTRTMKKKVEKEQEIEAQNKNIEQLNQNIETSVISQRDLETKIYRMSGDNMMKMNEKDNLIMLLPEIVCALRKQPNDLNDKILELQDQDLKKIMRNNLAIFKGI